MTPTTTINVKVTELPEVKAALDEASREIKRLRQECNDWEERYEELLAAVGGVWPG